MRPNCWKLVGIEKPEIFIGYVSTGRNDERKGKIVITDTNILNVIFLLHMRGKLQSFVNIRNLDY